MDGADPKLSEGDTKVATPKSPNVTVAGDAKHGWHVEVFDGRDVTTHSPEAETADEAAEAALDAHAATVGERAKARLLALYPGLAEAVEALVGKSVDEKIGAIQSPDAAKAAVDAVMPAIEQHIEAKISATLVALSDRVAALEKAKTSA